MRKFNWGIIGAGHIASSFVQALAQNPQACCYALASRDENRARSFTSPQKFTRIYAGKNAYDRLCADPDVDIVYIATVHINHAELSLKALCSGKAVLCEKPAAVNEKELREVLDFARSHNLFYMEALWMKFNPAYRAVLEHIRCGKLGTLKLIQADFCINVPYEAAPRLYKPELAGGALLDTGIYPVAFALSCAAAACTAPEALIPDRLLSSVRIGTSGIDYWNAALMEWDAKTRQSIRKPDAEIDTYGEAGRAVAGIRIPNAKKNSILYARLSSAIDTAGTEFFSNAVLSFTKGKILLRRFWQAQELELYDENDDFLKKETYPFKINGYEYEIEETHRCISDGLCESPLHSHKSTTAVIRTLDTLRAQWNLVYPFETGVNVKTKTVTRSSGGFLQNEIIVYSDGACSGNPGPGGWGAVILCGGKEFTCSGGEKATTNNRMELSGAIGALEKVLSVLSASSQKIIFYIDSQYVKNGISNWIHTWKTNGWKTSDKKPVKNKDLWEKLDFYTQKLDIDWHWVKGHSGSKYNEMCDKLAVEARLTAATEKK